MTRPVFLLLLALIPLATSAGAQTLKEKREGPAAPGDTLPSVVNREFELYGPTAEEVRKANDELRVAISQFGRYLGEQPKKMAFVLFRSAAEASGFDTRPLTRRRMQIVPWILPPSPRGGSPPAGGVPPDPLAHEAGHQFLIAYVEHARAQAAESGTQLPDPGTTPGGAAAAGGGTAATPGTASHADVPALPDWLEEGVAGLCERPPLQRGRIDFIRARIDQRIPFAELLTMRRPGAGGKGGAKGGKPDAAAIFCSEALALARFIAEREDDRFVGTVVEGVLRGRTVGDVLNTSQNLLSKPEALEKQWLEWMQGAGRAP
jgi:hypothetical protein